MHYYFFNFLFSSFRRCLTVHTMLSLSTGLRHIGKNPLQQPVALNFPFAYIGLLFIFCLTIHFSTTTVDILTSVKPRLFHSSTTSKCLIFLLLQLICIVAGEYGALDIGITGYRRHCFPYILVLILSSFRCCKSQAKCSFSTSKCCVDRWLTLLDVKIDMLAFECR